ncbi:unnamed protein product [Clonostachys chloroleuca]|uniref:Uncharacterized protein n=1 Tax=Clonostachys chloroleuca TaxID=1926264 RepID=A0AA35LP03_9HYPO|nr:unnamed protein product [Clonostachys chloroleuca]
MEHLDDDEKRGGATQAVPGEQTDSGDDEGPNRRAMKGYKQHVKRSKSKREWRRNKRERRKTQRRKKRDALLRAKRRGGHSTSTPSRKLPSDENTVWNV